MFHGKEILSGEKLKDEKDFIITELGKTGRKTAIHKYRDIIKKSFFGVNFALIGIENQTDIQKDIIFSWEDTKILSQWLKKAAKTESIEEFLKVCKSAIFHVFTLTRFLLYDKLRLIMG